MTLKPQRRPQPRRSAPAARGAAPARNGAKPRGRQAKRPGVPLRRRLSKRLPSIRRLLAGLGAAATAAGLVALLSGPWLRVTEVTWAGEQFTSTGEIVKFWGGMATHPNARLRKFSGFSVVRYLRKR